MTRDRQDNPSRSRGTDGARGPWYAPLTVAQIPEGGVTRHLVPTDAETDALASTGGLLGLRDVDALLTAVPERGDRIHVTGRVKAHVTQACVVSLDPVDSDIDEVVDLLFAPPEMVRSIERARDEAAEDDERPDPPEPIENDTIDLGRVATDALMLGLDPYPRKPGVAFEPAQEIADPAAHPFAALQALKADKAT